MAQQPLCSTVYAQEAHSWLMLRPYQYQRRKSTPRNTLLLSQVINCPYVISKGICKRGSSLDHVKGNELLSAFETKLSKTPISLFLFMLFFHFSDQYVEWMKYITSRVILIHYVLEAKLQT